MKPVFIGGTGRSGTTILKRALNSQPRVVALPGELRVIVDPGGALDLIDALSHRWSPYSADAAIQAFRRMLLDCGRSRSVIGLTIERFERNLFRSLGISPRRYLGMGFRYYFGPSIYSRLVSRLVGQLSHHLSPGSWTGSPPWRRSTLIYESEPISRSQVEEIVRDFFLGLYQGLASDKGHQTHWVDDTPMNLLYAHELLRLFPEMRLIHVYRDPRDVLASYVGFVWGGDDYVAIARRLAGIYQRWYEIRQGLPTDCYVEVELEALASDPKPILTGICKFIGLDFEEALTTIRLDKVHAGRWKREIPKREWERAKPYLSRFVEIYGYEQ